MAFARFFTSTSQRAFNSLKKYGPYGGAALAQALIEGPPAAKPSSSMHAIANTTQNSTQLDTKLLLDTTPRLSLK